MPRGGALLAVLSMTTALGVANSSAQTLTNPDPKPAPASRAPAKSSAEERVKTCSAFGPGFVQLAGTDACVKIGGGVTTDVTGTDN